MKTYSLAGVFIEDSAHEHAGAAATLLGVRFAEALGLLTAVFRHATRSFDGRAPTGVLKGRAAVLRLEAAARWEGERGALVKALEVLGLLVREAKKIRIKGVFRLAARAWKRREQARKREKARRAAQKALAVEQPKPAGVVSRKMNALVGKLASIISVSSNIGTDDDGKPVVAHPIGCWTQMMRDRQSKTSKLPDRTPHEDWLSWFGRRVSEGISPIAIVNAWNRYLGDETFEARAWPLALFMQPGVYQHRITQ